MPRESGTSQPNRVRELREACGLSQWQLARRAKIAARTVCNVERGAPCRMDTKRKLLLALGLRFDARGDVFPSAAVFEAGLSSCSPKQSEELVAGGGDERNQPNSRDNEHHPERVSERFPHRVTVTFPWLMGL
jgi:DNA-binding XRE family transcriptional regulator